MLIHELLSQEGEEVLRSFSRLLTYGSRYTAAVLTHIAVIDARNLYLAEGFESMMAFCMGRMELTEDSAKKWIQVARVARELPQLLPAIADRRLSMFSARLLAPRLTKENVAQLIDEVAHKPAREVEIILARHYPSAEILRLDDGVTGNADCFAGSSTQVIAAQSPESNPGAARHPEFVKTVRPSIKPLTATRFTLQLTLSDVTHGKLRHFQDLLGHSVPNGDLAEVIDRALDEAILQYERRKFGLGARSGRRKAKASIRSIPAQIKRAVYERDRGACAFRFEDGRICGSRSKLEFDHIIPIAKGGKTRVDNLRLLCRAHNQHAADQAFGQAFMDRKRASRRRFYGAR